MFAGPEAAATAPRTVPEQSNTGSKRLRKPSLKAREADSSDEGAALAAADRAPPSVREVAQRSLRQLSGSAGAAAATPEGWASPPTDLQLVADALDATEFSQSSPRSNGGARPSLRAAGAAGAAQRQRAISSSPDSVGQTPARTPFGSPFLATPALRGDEAGGLPPAAGTGRRFASDQQAAFAPGISFAFDLSAAEASAAARKFPSWSVRHPFGFPPAEVAGNGSSGGSGGAAGERAVAAARLLGAAAGGRLLTSSSSSNDLAHLRYSLPASCSPNAPSDRGSPQPVLDLSAASGGSISYRPGGGTSPTALAAALHAALPRWKVLSAMPKTPEAVGVNLSTPGPGDNGERRWPAGATPTPTRNASLSAEASAATVEQAAGIAAAMGGAAAGSGGHGNGSGTHTRFEARLSAIMQLVSGRTSVFEREIRERLGDSPDTSKALRA